MSIVTDNYAKLATGIGFIYDAPTNTIYGTKDGYELLIYATDRRYPYLFTITTSARSANGMLGKEDISLFKKSVAPAAGLSQKDSLITVIAKNNTSKQDKICENIQYILDALTAFLRERNFVPCCQTCGASTQTVGFMLKDARFHFCADCAARAKNENEVLAQQNERKSVNIIGGIIGAVAGSLIGVACIVILGQLGYVAAVSGIVMAFCTLKGFGKLAGKLTVVGIVLSCIIMIAMTYFGNRLDWAIEISKAMNEYYGYEVGIFDSFRAIPTLIAELDGMGDYILSFLQQMLFVVIGAIPTIISISKDQKNLNHVAQIGYMQNAGTFANFSSNNNASNF